MADQIPLPSRAKLLELLEKLLPDNKDMDEVSASIILDRQGVDRARLANALQLSLERRIAHMRASGEDVPPALAEILAILERKTESQEEGTVDPGAWIDNLLRGPVPEIRTGADQAGHLQAFRPRGTEPLTEEDIEILRDLAAELEANGKDHE